MKILSLFKRFKQSKKQTLNSYKEEIFIKQGSEQFALLIKKGLGIPVALL